MRDRLRAAHTGLALLVIALASGAACKDRASVLGPRGDAGAVVVLSSAALGPAPDQIEVEPNDDLKTATPVVMGAQPIVLGGILSVTAGKVDRDRFSLRLPPVESGDAMGPSRRLRVELLVLPTPGVDLPEMSLVAIRGLKAVLSVPTTIPPEGEPPTSVVIPNLGADESPLDLAVSFRDKVFPETDRQIAYRLRIEPGIVAAGVEREPNARPAEATPMVAESLTMEMSGWLGWAGDIDYFVLPKAVLNGAPAVDVEVELPTDVQATVAVFSSDGEQLGISPTGSRRLVLSGSPVGTGETVLLQVRGRRRFSTTEPYVLLVRPASAVSVPVDGGPAKNR
ncbi:MAG: hypothetical protein SGI86_13045 [Deltaproteobacteria bacterium]|nr:hypothetical protein [Deltaproteobacteria bacterium]